jgi:peptidyl-prolyl cis-trans isomerase SurA
MGGAWADDAPVAVATSAVPTAAEAKLPPEDASAIVDGLAAHVNGDAITIADVMVGVRMFLRDPAWEAGRGREEAFRDAYAEALGELVNQRLILQEYRAGQVRLPAWVIEKRLAELLDTRFDGDRGRLLKELADQRLTVEDWRTRVEEQMIVAAMRQSQVDAHIQIGPSQILAHYQAHVTNYVQKAATQVGLILLKPRGDEGEEALAARAAAVLQRLKSGEKFEAVARDVSDDSSREDGGQWGWIVPEEVLRDELAQALAALPVQQHKAVAMSTGTYILHKMAERKAGQRTIEEARPEIERELFKAESQRLFLAWMMRLRAKAHIQTFDILK